MTQPAEKTSCRRKDMQLALTVFCVSSWHDDSKADWGIFRNTATGHYLLIQDHEAQLINDNRSPSDDKRLSE